MHGTRLIVICQIAVLTCVAVNAADTYNGGPDPWELEKFSAISFAYAAPLVTANIQVSKGEKLVFNVEISDKDRKRPKPAGGAPGAWIEIANVGPYDLVWKITGDAEFDSLGSGSTDKTIHGSESGNLYVFVKASWNETTPISVKVTVKDNAPAPVAPNTGSATDPDAVREWTLVKRTKPCPTDMHTVTGTVNSFVPCPATYTYEMLPDLPPAGHPDYENQTVLESFGSKSAGGGFAMTDLTAAWKAANPLANTPDKAAAVIFPNSGNNGTFVIDATDRIADQHNGFGDTLPFTPAAKAAGVSWTMQQTYSCGGHDIKMYTLTRRYKAGTIENKKTGP